MTHVVYQQLDYSNEKSSTTIQTAVLGAANFVAFNTESDQMRNAIAGICLGTMSAETIVSEQNDLSSVTPTDVNAQRERKWKVSYMGNVTKKKFFLTLPCADPVGRLQTKSDKGDLTQTEVAAFVTRFESFAKSPDDPTEAVTVLDIELVGRNL